MRPTIGVVVPALAAGGGVPAVASFLCRGIEESRAFELRVFSLATSSRDRDSQLMSSPRTWQRAPSSSKGSWEGRDFTHFGAPLAELEFMRFQPRPTLTAALRKCDLIQVVAGSPAHALVAAHCLRPVVLQVATLVAAERAGAAREGSAALRLWRRGMTHITAHFDDEGLRAADAVLVENSRMRKHAEHAVAGGRTTVSMAYPGVDCDFFVPSPLRAAQLRKDPCILFVGRLSDPRKNLGLLARAYRNLCRSQPGSPPLVLAGLGDLLPAASAEFEKLADPSRVCVINGPSQRELLELYQRASCVVLSSHEEGFGMVLIEAMACGVPVVATRCGGPEEIVTEGIDGYLVALGDNESDVENLLAQRLHELCADPVRNLRMGEAARATCLQRFSNQAAFRPFLSTYQRLLS